MRVEDVIEGLNRHIEYIRKVNNLEVKSHLVLKKVISVNPNFKAYKEYTNVPVISLTPTLYNSLVTDSVYRMLTKIE